MYAHVLVEYNVKNLDKTFTYKIGKELQDKIKVGMKVKVPFNNTKINGFVVAITDSCDFSEVKEVSKIVDEDLILNEELLELGKYLQSKTLCSLISAYQTMLPSSLKIKDQKHKYVKYETYLYLNSSTNIKEYINKNSRYKNQIKLLTDLLNKKEVLKKDYNSSSVQTFLKKTRISSKTVQLHRININNKIKSHQKLTAEQDKVFKTVKAHLNEAQTYLLYGITGSGKTEVYIHLIAEVIKNKKKALLLVPEITLSAQIVKRFYELFGSKVAIFHSALSDGEKYDEYSKIMHNEIDVVVGTRSAIFAPIKHLGIIIIDEEHSQTYKQENMPRYHTLDMALFRSKYNNIPLILGSATPSLESMARAQKGVYKLLTLQKRIGNSTLPHITMVNMQEEMQKRNMIFSDLLINKIKTRLINKEQTILLLNRRGHSTIVTCQNCGFTYKCPHCEISLTYHKTTSNLRCHYCGYTIFKPQVCPECQEEALNYYGIGTEKLEAELKKQFPTARIVRMDVDTTSKKGSQEKIITSFLNQEYDILLGTQMISKGLDFPKVTLVGIISADTSLNMPDFRAFEKTFSLLTQTAGRAGRASNNGEVIIQSFDPNNPIFEFIKNNDYDGFYRSEMIKRHTLDYPPYYYLVSLRVTSASYDDASSEANRAASYLRKNLNKNTIILGPTTASIFRLNNIYRFQIIIKYKYDDNLLSVLKQLDEMYILNRKVNLEIDLSPNVI